jgi:DNA-binding MarR family transcriptional regulator
MAGKRLAPVEAVAIDLGPLPGLVGYTLRRAQLAVFQDFHAGFATLDLSPAEFFVLLVISRNPGLRQGQIADALGIQPPNFAVLLGRMAKRGLAERRKSARDRRAVALHLTAAGETLLARALVLLEQHEQRLIGRLGEAKRKQLLRLLRDLA